ncbi:MAG: hypothetical protein R3C20_06590 [Planctomycetaceae bacterium]
MSPALHFQAASGRQYMARRSTGCIGIEFDASGIACAQAEFADGQWNARLDRYMQHPAASDASSESQPVTAAMLPVASTDLLMLTAGANTPSVKCVLPMELCDLRVMYLPEAPPEEMRLLVQRELESGGMRDPLFDFWTIPVEYSTHHNLVPVNAIIGNPYAIGQVVSLFGDGGFSLNAIDTIPTASARAVNIYREAKRRLDPPACHEDEYSLLNIVGTGSNSDAAAAIAVHAGWYGCTYTLVTHGIPMLARVPVRNGLRSLVQPLASLLGMPQSDVLRMMRGLSRNLPVRASDRLLRTLVESCRNWAVNIAEEILKTIAYSSRPGFRIVPSEIIVIGPGSIVPGIAEILELEVNIESFVWKICSSPDSAEGSSDINMVPMVWGESAVALALSASQEIQ